MHTSLESAAMPGSIGSQVENAGWAHTRPMRERGLGWGGESGMKHSGYLHATSNHRSFSNSSPSYPNCYNRLLGAIYHNVPLSNHDFFPYQACCVFRVRPSPRTILSSSPRKCPEPRKHRSPPLCFSLRSFNLSALRQALTTVQRLLQLKDLHCRRMLPGTGIYCLPRSVALLEHTSSPSPFSVLPFLLLDDDFAALPNLLEERSL